MSTSQKRTLTHYLPQRKSLRSCKPNRYSPIPKSAQNHPTAQHPSAKRLWTAEEDNRLLDGLTHHNIRLNGVSQLENVPEGFWDIMCGFFGRSANACRVHAAILLRKIETGHNNQVGECLDEFGENLKVLNDFVQQLDALSVAELALLPPARCATEEPESTNPPNSPNPLNPLSTMPVAWNPDSVGDLLQLDDIFDLNDELNPPSTPRLRPSPPPSEKVPPRLLPIARSKSNFQGSLLPQVSATRRPLFDDIRPAFSFCNPYTPKSCKRTRVLKARCPRALNLTDKIDDSLTCDESMQEIEEHLCKAPKTYACVFKITLGAGVWAN